MRNVFDHALHCRDGNYDDKTSLYHWKKENVQFI